MDEGRRRSIAELLLGHLGQQTTAAVASLERPPTDVHTAGSGSPQPHRSTEEMLNSSVTARAVLSEEGEMARFW